MLACHTMSGLPCASMPSEKHNKKSPAFQTVPPQGLGIGTFSPGTRTDCRQFTGDSFTRIFLRVIYNILRNESFQAPRSAGVKK